VDTVDSGDMVDTVDTVDMVDNLTTLSTLDTLDTLNTLDTAVLCLLPGPYITMCDFLCKICSGNWIFKRKYKKNIDKF
jgi:hypothetical protein